MSETKPTLQDETVLREDIELSVVMPCLDEAETLPGCIDAAKKGIADAGVRGEIVIADNGSTDGSPEIAERCGARVVHIQHRGYGSALRGGIGAARGKFVIMGDADSSYDFTEIPKFVTRLREGFDLVMGCRLPSGGGTVMPGAMPLMHRLIGNPVFTLICRLWFHVPIHDMHCGLRGFRREFQQKLGQRCTGMEFADEMVLRTIFADGRIAEIPITLHPDGRTAHGPHLRTFRDGWRTLRFLLMYSPRWLFLIPGSVFIGLGLLGYAVAFPGLRIGGIHFDVNTLMISSLSILVGFQVILFAAFTKTFAIVEGILPEDEFSRRAFQRITLELGLIMGAVAVMAGTSSIVVALFLSALECQSHLHRSSPCSARLRAGTGNSQRPLALHYRHWRPE